MAPHPLICSLILAVVECVSLVTQDRKYIGVDPLTHELITTNSDPIDLHFESDRKGGSKGGLGMLMSRDGRTVEERNGRLYLENPALGHRPIRFKQLPEDRPAKRPRRERDRKPRKSSKERSTSRSHDGGMTPEDVVNIVTDVIKQQTQPPPPTKEIVPVSRQELEKTFNLVSAALGAPPIPLSTSPQSPGQLPGAPPVPDPTKPQASVSLQTPSHLNGPTGPYNKENIPPNASSPYKSPYAYLTGTPAIEKARKHPPPRDDSAKDDAPRRRSKRRRDDDDVDEDELKRRPKRRRDDDDVDKDEPKRRPKRRRDDDETTSEDLEKRDKYNLRTGETLRGYIKREVNRVMDERDHRNARLEHIISNYVNGKVTESRVNDLTYKKKDEKKKKKKGGTPFSPLTALQHTPQAQLFKMATNALSSDESDDEEKD